MALNTSRCSASKVLAAVEAIYDCASNPSFWPTALQRVADVFDDVGAILSYQRDDGGFAAIGSASLKGLLQEFSSSWQGQDLRALRGLKRGVYLKRDAVTDRHVVSDRELLEHPFYQYLARHGLRYFAGVPISPDPSVTASLAVQRSVQRDPYTDEELAVVTELGRHAEKSLRLGVLLMDSKSIGLTMADALSRLGIGVFVLDSLERIIFTNPAADQITELLGITTINSPLRFPPFPDRDKFEQMIKEAVSGLVGKALQDPRPVRLENRDLKDAATLYVLPASGTASAIDAMLVNARAIVLAIKSSGSIPDPAQVRDLLGVTLGEARVAALVGNGSTPRQAAATLGITEETVRTTLKRVFSKVGVSRQSELAILLTRLTMH